ncbi:hypothetical protein Cs7R123_78540 [Catellatospora sp. TT07R-123]|uniref:TadE/TadG family type IV pilus assembly protein n=1 Tax=Catellatospora sp. TT07R-123 TaxID=2733863 RepID=UPI001B044173|nr:TadE/TadG family type IV pilus assembly protein [Catellatospora sp. TT07R-123]GHJ50512.1 hypothetical protein Cs7R123_78540 [Catellatospora sp. TT07R-123]
MTRRDRGSATAELAVALPAVVLLLVAGLGAVAAVTTKLGCEAAARDAALAAARGADVPAGASVTATEDTVTATVQRSIKVTTLTCAATAAREPGAP